MQLARGEILVDGQREHVRSKVLDVSALAGDGVGAMVPELECLYAVCAQGPSRGGFVADHDGVEQRAYAVFELRMKRGHGAVQRRPQRRVIAHALVSNGVEVESPQQPV